MAYAKTYLEKGYQALVMAAAGHEGDVFAKMHAEVLAEMKKHAAEQAAAGGAEPEAMETQ